MFRTLNFLFFVVAIALVFFTVFFVLLIGDPHKFWEFVSTNKILPRFIAWSCLLVGLYGIARRRFSLQVTMLLFAVAFFFAYLGKFVFKGMY